jgi:adenosylhomocysteinase
MKGMGARVIVVEAGGSLGRAAGGEASGYHRALEALYTGYEVMSMEQAAKVGDIFVTATGNKHVIAARHFALLKDGAILANAGHFDVEIDVEGLGKAAKSKKNTKENVDEYLMADGRCIYLLSEGRLVNLARPSGQGHPSEIMDASFAVQALCAERIAKSGEAMPKAVHPVPFGLDELVAQLVLEAQGVRLEPPTAEQKKYAESA